ncbi:MAG TPA: hypothetical protein VJ984_05795 [Xanthomonadales bacterium]|nr:hypothetical protein [Xanthomonadales bacterium]
MHARITRKTQRNRISRLTLLALAAPMVLFLNACTQFGPGLVKAGRNDYNIAVSQTSNEQTLLNLVRLRYSDNPLWLSVGSVTTQFNIASGGSAGYDQPESGDYNWNLGGAVTYSETPTITYTPVVGEAFVRNILRPMDFDTFMLLANSGWDIDSLLRLTASRLNGLPNAPTSEGSTPELAPEYRDFVRATGLLRVLQTKDALRFRYQDPGEDTIPTLYIREDALDWPEVSQLRELLGLEEKKRLYNLHIIADKQNPVSIGIDFRSLAEMLQFLSTSVQIPHDDIEAGRVVVTRDESGRTFDWEEVTDGLFAVHSQDKSPDYAAVAVRYRGSWFYIDDSDMHTKNTFRLLSMVGSILAGKTEQDPPPVLTIPVGR